jgi:hypothetical protein
MKDNLFGAEPERIINYKDLTKGLKAITPPLQTDCVIMHITNLTDATVHICSTLDYTEEVISLDPGNTCIKDLNMGKKIKHSEPFFCWKKGGSFYIRWVGKTPTKGTVHISMLFAKENK